MAATGRAALDLNIHVQGVREVERALDALPPDAFRRLKTATQRIGRDLARRIKAAGRADTRQSARAAATTRFSGSRGGATVKVGPHPLLFGSEFGANGRYGFYAASRYRESPGRLFRPHRGQNSYWLFRSAEQAQPEIEAQFRAVVDEIIRDFG